MQAAKQVLISFFEQVAKKDKLLVNELKQHQCFSVQHERWGFTLPDLYVFLQHYHDAFSRIDYKQFRQLVFASYINQAVKLNGAEIIIMDNRGKVDDSSYALVWRPAD